MTLKPFLALATLATVTAADPTNLTVNPLPVLPSPLLIVTQELNVSRWATDVTLMFSTNRVTNILSILSTTPVPGNCPECGAPSHHSRQVSLMTAYDVVYLTALSQGSSNTMRISTGSATNWVSTNLIPRTVQPYSSPGWPTPVPPLTK